MMLTAERIVNVRSSTIDSLDIDPSRGRISRDHVHLGPVSISGVTFGMQLNAHCQDIGANYYLHLPISGGLRFCHRGVDLVASREMAAVFEPRSGEFTGRWTPGCRVLCVTFDRAAVVLALARLTRSEPVQPLRFEVGVDTRTAVVRSWIGIMTSLLRQAASAESLLSNPLVAAPLAESVVNGLLVATRHSYSHVFASDGPRAHPKTVRTAIEMMEADPQQPWTVAMLADACQVGVRALQTGFRKHVDTSPMGYLRDVRLRRAHEELRTSDPATTSVALVASRWGLTHLGRFARAYETKYGQTPSRTLRMSS